MNQILCVIDFSESSGKVLEVAARIAKACTAHLTVLHPYRLIRNGYNGDIPSLKRKLETEARENFQSLVKGIDGFTGISFEFLSEIGFTADRIHSHARKSSIDLVIIGQPQDLGPNDLKSFNLQHLISHSGLPFVIVPAQVPAETSV